MNEKRDVESVELSRHDVYGLDSHMTSKLDLIPEVMPESAFLAHVVAPDPYAIERSRRNGLKDWIAIIASSGKVAEISVLWLYNARMLCMISALCWIYFLFASIILQFFGLSREYPEGSDRPEIDTITGQLPTPIKNGGSYKILLGASENVRSSLYWKIAWGLGAIVSTTTVIAS